jgi:hypothetical protein
MLLKPPPPQLNLSQSLEKSLQSNVSQEDYLESLQKKLEKIESSRTKSDTTMRFRKGTANELQKLARATLEYEHNARREAMLKSPLVDNLSTVKGDDEENNNNLASISLLDDMDFKMYDDNESGGSSSSSYEYGGGKYDYDKYYPSSSDEEEEGEEDKFEEENGNHDGNQASGNNHSQHHALVEERKKAPQCCERCSVQ